MANVKKEMNDATKDVVSDAQDLVEGAAARAKEMAAGAAKTAKHEAGARADAAKGAAAQEVGNVASALRKAAVESRSGSAQERSFGQIAHTLADASDAIKNKDLGTVVEDVSSFARKHPMTFLAGAALAGLAVSRMIKASEPVQHDDAEASNDDPDKEDAS
jgi:hypothetical protein